MSFGPAFDAKEQIRQAIDIVDLVGGYVQLRRQGRNFVGICPWHDDSRPSLQVNPDRQSFKCWVCDYGGDIFSFIMRAENLEFREAIELLAERAGVVLRPTPRHFSETEPGGPSVPSGGAADRPDPLNDKRALLRVLSWAEEQFHRFLVSAAEAEPGRAYLADRKLNDETVRRFRLGFAPNRWDWLLEQARRENLPIALLERVGLLRRRELEGGGVGGGSGHYDWFRGRVMFPIRDARSRCIAFGGRVLPQLADDRSAKYINSPETPLFSKNRELYGLDAAREHFKNAGGAIVMEGYTDCLMAHQHGIPNCVAVLGTALGDRHLQLLRRYTDSITLVLDGDAAGRRRTNEILDALLALFEKNSVDLRILTLPEGIDPCDFIVEHGSQQFLQLVDEAVDALEHKFNTVTNGLDTLTDTHRASQAAEQLLAALAQIRPAGGGASSQVLLREEQMLSRIARKFHLQEEMLRSRLRAIRRGAQKQPAAQRAAVSTSAAEETGEGGPATSLPAAELPTWDREVIELMLLDAAMATRLIAVVAPAAFTSPVARRIFVGYCRLAEHGIHGDFGRLLAAFDEPWIKNILVEFDESASAKTAADRERWLADLLESHRRRDEEVARRTSLAAARQDQTNAEQLLAQFCQQSSNQHRAEYERRKK
ncbi:MAG: DNA primase [Pirellulales bacterium]|nr:DNA primase [Pirellulales bacterium]